MNRKIIQTLLGIGLLVGTAHANTDPSGAYPRIQSVADAMLSQTANELENDPEKLTQLSDPTRAHALVNPFNGKLISAEDLQHELEMTQYRSMLLEEQLKQTNTLAEINYVPIRRELEAEQTRTQLKKEELSQKQVEEEINPPPPPPPPPPPEPPKEDIKSPAQIQAEMAAARAAERKAKRAAAELAAKTPPATLLSVIKIGSEFSVVLDVKGAITTVKHGSEAPVGLVTVVDESTAIVNGWTLKVHEQTMGRFVESDKAQSAVSSMVSSGSSMPTSGSSGMMPTNLPPPIPEDSPFAKGFPKIDSPSNPFNNGPF